MLCSSRVESKKQLPACDRIYWVLLQLREWMFVRWVPRRSARLIDDALLVAAVELETAETLSSDWMRRAARKRLEKALDRIAQLLRNGHLSVTEHSWVRDEIVSVLDETRDGLLAPLAMLQKGDRLLN